MQHPRIHLVFVVGGAVRPPRTRGGRRCVGGASPATTGATDGAVAAMAPRRCRCVDGGPEVGIVVPGGHAVAAAAVCGVEAASRNADMVGGMCLAAGNGRLDRVLGTGVALAGDIVRNPPSFLTRWRIGGAIPSGRHRRHARRDATARAYGAVAVGASARRHGTVATVCAVDRPLRRSFGATGGDTQRAYGVAIASVHLVRGCGDRRQRHGLFLSLRFGACLSRRSGAWSAGHASPGVHRGGHGAGRAIAVVCRLDRPRSTRCRPFGRRGRVATVVHRGGGAHLHPTRPSTLPIRPGEQSAV
eukprot:ctg_1114.g458